MFALAAVISFVMAFILKLMNVATGNVDLVILGLVFVAAHILVGDRAPWRRP